MVIVGYGENLGPNLKVGSLVTGLTLVVIRVKKPVKVIKKVDFCKIGQNLFFLLDSLSTLSI